MDSNRKNDDKFKMYNNKIILSIYYYAGWLVLICAYLGMHHHVLSI